MPPATHKKRGMNVLFHRCLTAVCLSAIGCFVVPQQASASHESPVYCAAEWYREAVRDFERHVLRIRYIERCDERLVDDLEDSTSRLRSAARHPDRLDRLFERFAETDVLHCRVETVFFTEPIYPPNRELEICWRRVAHAYGALVEEMRCLGSQHHHGHRYPLGTGGHDHPTRPTAGLVIPVPTLPITAPITAIGPGPGIRGTLPPQNLPRLPRADSMPRSASVPQGAVGADLQRGRQDVTPSYSRRTITTRDQLRSAVFGALLQRR